MVVAMEGNHGLVIFGETIEQLTEISPLKLKVISTVNLTELSVSGSLKTQLSKSRSFPDYCRVAT